MTTNKRFKAEVRARMEQFHESYSVAAQRVKEDWDSDDSYLDPLFDPGHPDSDADIWPL